MTVINNKSHTLIEAMRKDTVAKLRIRGLSIEEIRLEIAGNANYHHLLNPHTQKPYSSTTIQNDLAEIEKEWEERCKVTIDSHKARQFAELQAVKKRCWDKDEYDHNRDYLKTILDAIKLESDIVGTKSEKKVMITSVLDTLSEDELESYKKDY